MKQLKTNLFERSDWSEPPSYFWLSPKVAKNPRPVHAIPTAVAKPNNAFDDSSHSLLKHVEA